MANIKSAKKRIRVSKKRTDNNKAKRTFLKTVMKNTVVAVSEGNIENVSKTVSIIDKSSAKGLIHKNKAARMKSQLAKKANAV
ncbi:MAG: 30S ribosomal protein S20 [Clostridiales bacterium]|nr:30S ribosomal protein S20 [Clostridiales bacterium]